MEARPDRDAIMSSHVSSTPLKMALGLLVGLALMDATPWIAALCSGVLGAVLATLAGSDHGLLWGLFEAMVGGVVGLVLTMRAIVRRVVNA